MPGRPDARVRGFPTEASNTAAVGTAVQSHVVLQEGYEEVRATLKDTRSVIPDMLRDELTAVTGNCKFFGSLWE